MPFSEKTDSLKKVELTDSLQAPKVLGKPIYFHHLMMELLGSYLTLLASTWKFKNMQVMCCAIWYYLRNLKNVFPAMGEYYFN